ncbi:MAG TPA: hypothetical protein VIL30_18375 [Ramlibacter sp.]
MADLGPAVGRLLLAVCAIGATGAGAQEASRQGHFDVSLSHEFSSGRYGEPSSTRIQQTTLGLRYRTPTWFAELELPWIQVRDEAGAALPGVAGSSAAAAEQGLGDAWLKAGIELREADAQTTGLDLVAKVKTRTGNAARGLGSGGIDYAVQLEALRPIAGFNVFGHLGWRHTGDVPGARPYRDPFYAEVGASRKLSPAVEAGFFVDWRDSVGRLGPQRDATVYAAYGTGPWRYQVYVSKGFSRASADAALGLGVRRRF